MRRRFPLLLANGPVRLLAEPAFETPPSRLAEIDHLLSRQSEHRCQLEISERQLVPQRLQPLRRQAGHARQLVEPGDPQQDELRGGIESIGVTEVEQDGGPLGRGKSNDLAPGGGEGVVRLERLVRAAAPVRQEGEGVRGVLVGDVPEIGHDPLQSLEGHRRPERGQNGLEGVGGVGSVEGRGREIPPVERGGIPRRCWLFPRSERTEELIVDVAHGEPRIVLQNVAQTVAQPGALRKAAAQEVVDGVVSECGGVVVELLDGVFLENEHRLHPPQEPQQHRRGDVLRGPAAENGDRLAAAGEDPLDDRLDDDGEHRFQRGIALALVQGVQERTEPPVALGGPAARSVVHPLAPAIEPSFLRFTATRVY
jgi:hypothetical protein